VEDQLYGVGVADSAGCDLVDRFEIVHLGSPPVCVCLYLV
jgi:hypothetical protein